MLRCRVARDLGDLRIADITRYDHLDPWKAGLAQELAPAGVRKHWPGTEPGCRDDIRTGVALDRNQMIGPGNAPGDAPPDPITVLMAVTSLVSALAT